MIKIVREDLVVQRVDAIVNAANEVFRGGGGVDGAIHDAAGPELLAECERYPGLPTGEAILTPGYNLAARYVIHTVGPIWGSTPDSSVVLERAYENVFRVALQHADITSLAFPAISTGAFGFPKAAAARIAVTSMRRHEGAFRRLLVCITDTENFQAYRTALSPLHGTGQE